MTTETMEPETQAEREQAAPVVPNERPVCTHCDAHAVCQAAEPNGGGVVPLCHEHAGVARAEGRDLFTLGGPNVPFEYVPTAQKVFNDPEDAEPEPPVDPTSPEALAEYDARTVELVNEEAETVARYERAYEAAAEEAKACKKDFEKAEKELRELIEDRKKNRGKPKQPTLYRDPVPEKEPTPDAQTEVDATPKPEPDATGVWQGNHEFTPQELATPLSSLSVPQGVLNALNEGRKKDGSSFTPITTVGEYFAYLQPLANGWCPKLTDIKGVGEAKAEGVETAILDFTAECCEAKRKANAV